ncbi:MAG TPA: error-prone DNA polymerase [Opitutus sp.]|nr:error-prone DNA polymerase [Opitutus sp.]
MSAGETRDNYVELHANSAFSFLRGTTPPDKLVAEAARLQLPGLAVLDRDGVYGAARAYNAAFETGLKPIVGAEITMEDGSVLPLLVMNQRGYQNLSRLISTAKLEDRPREAVELWSRGVLAVAGTEEARRGRRVPTMAGADPRERKRPCFATWRELAEHAEGLIALTGDEEGPVLRAYCRAGLPDPVGIEKRAATAGSGDPALQPDLEATMERLEKIFGKDRLYVEVQRRRIRGEHVTGRMLADLAAARGLPLVATGGVRYATRPERMVADVFTCLRNHTTLDAAGRLLEPNGERHLRSAADMRELFRDWPEAVAASGRLAERLEFTLDDLGYEFPDFPVGAGETMEGVLRQRAYEGARERFGGVPEKIARQIETELALIFELGFAGYFLIIWDICKWARGRGILIQGRGSAANSVVCYVLGITAVNPMRFELLFDRFLSRGRIGKRGHRSWPDVDLDLPSGDLRESVIQEVYRRYAPRGAAMVANVITYRGRSAMREVGKVLGFSDDVLGRFSALYGNGDFEHTLEVEQQARMAGLPGKHPRLPALIGLYRRIKGLPRHLGQHSGGMVLCPNRLDAVVPIEPATMEGRCVVQWDKDDCEELGLVKIDFLGLGMMAVLQETFALCAERGGPKALADIPEDDPQTYAAAGAADTVGVFQIESRAQMATLPRFRPKNLYDLAMQVSIVRPGPIVGKLVHPLIRRRQGLEDVDFIDESIEPIVKPILARTKGVILFQEQMLKIAMDVGGFDASEAEELRRAMGFTRGEERLERSLVKLGESMRRKGLKDVVIEKVVSSCRSFAAYGFPESHAISFALLAYASTWLKVHRPAEFYAGLLNNQPMGFYSPATLIQDARRHGLKVQPVCVLRSRWECTVEGDALRVGLRYVCGVQEKRVRTMLAERDARAFASMEDFLARTNFIAVERRALAAVGALGSLSQHRRAALWQVEAAWPAEENLLRGCGLPSATPTEAPPADAGDCHTLYDKSQCHIMYDKCEGRRGEWMPAETEVKAEAEGGAGFAPVANEAKEAGAMTGVGPATPEPRWLPDKREARGDTCAASPLAPMTREERLQADFSGTGLTVGAHPMALVRARLKDAWCAAELPLGRDGAHVKIAGSVICRQRPGTAKGVVFVSLEDETGIANAIVAAELYERQRLTINEEPALCIGGRLQIQQGVIHVRAETIEALRLDEVPAQASHDFR